MTADAPARVRVEHDGDRTLLRDLTASRYLRPQLLGRHGDRPRVALVATCASLLAGDRVALEVDIGPGAHLELVEPSGTVAYDARGGSATWTADIRVATEGRLVWGAAPFVVAHGADVERRTDVGLESGAVVMLRETLVLGRSHETGGAVRSTLRARLDGRPLVVEEVDLADVRLRSAPGSLGPHRVLTTATLLGMRPAEVVDPHETRLSGPGAQRREVAEHAHEAEEALAGTWERWRVLVDADHQPLGDARRR